MRPAVARAPGKIILFGEHAVVYGHPAVAIPVTGVHTEARVEPLPNGGVQINAPNLGLSFVPPGPVPPELRAILRVAELTLEYLDCERQGLRLTLTSTIPVGRGLGSGAAACVATVRAIAAALEKPLEPNVVSQIAFEGEKIYHGNPSGIDNAVIACEAPIFFMKKKGPRRLEMGDTKITFVLGDTGIFQSTAEVVQDVAAARENDRARYDAIFWEMGTLACIGRELLKAGSTAELGVFMNRNHELLRSINVSSPELDRLVEAAREAGAAGAKLSGAGRGGSMIALVGDGEPDAIEAALKKAGAVNTIVTQLTG